jgi:hypothetical protein
VTRQAAPLAPPSGLVGELGSGARRWRRLPQPASGRARPVRAASVRGQARQSLGRRCRRPAASALPPPAPVAIHKHWCLIRRPTCGGARRGGHGNGGRVRAPPQSGAPLIERSCTPHRATAPRRRRRLQSAAPAGARPRRSGRRPRGPAAGARAPARGAARARRRPQDLRGAAVARSRFDRLPLPGTLNRAEPNAHTVRWGRPIPRRPRRSRPWPTSWRRSCWSLSSVSAAGRRPTARRATQITRSPGRSRGAPPPRPRGRRRAAAPRRPRMRPALRRARTPAAAAAARRTRARARRSRTRPPRRRRPRAARCSPSTCPPRGASGCTTTATRRRLRRGARGAGSGGAPPRAYQPAWDPWPPPWGRPPRVPGAPLSQIPPPPPQRGARPQALPLEARPV